MNYIPLNIKTHYELLSSLIKIDSLVSFAKNNGISALVITDSNMFGCMEFINLCNSSNIKSVIGVEIQVESLDMILYAKSFTGYVNLLNIVSERNTSTLNIKFLKEKKSDLICVTKDYLNYLNYKEIYDLVYLSYETSEEKKNALITTDKIVYMKKSLYISESDKEYLIYLSMIKDGKTIDNFEEYSFDNHLNIDIDEYDAKTTYEFANLINIELPKFHFKLPEYCEDKREVLKKLANKGLNKRLNGNITNEYQERLNEELRIINEMGFTDYFLIVYDFILYAKKNKIIVGPGRGSAAGSLVSYCIGITEIDPIKYDLIFERFLNPERITMPDIDIDIEYLRREELIEYVKSKYGYDKVANIITFGTLLSKQVLRDVGRILKMSNEKIDKLVSTIKDKETFNELETNPYFNQVKKEDIEYEKLIRISKKLEGLKRHTSIHAAGVIISDEPLRNKVPLYKSAETLLTGYTMEHLEAIGLLKMDFLAIKNLATIGTIVNKIKEATNIYIDVNKIPLDDTKTLKLFYNVNTIGIFQFESEGMMSFLKSLRIKEFDDLVSAIALYRPGPRESIPDFIAVRNKRKKPHYIVPELEDILKSTNGIIVYQEQILEILKKIGGFSYSTADNIRRAMSKKKEDIILKYKNDFVNGAINKGYNKNSAEEIYDLVLKFANYGFNKSHSVAYSLVAFQMAFLKAHFVEYYITTELDMVIGSEIKTKEYIDEARTYGLEIDLININESIDKYKVKDKQIILPLTIVKSIGKETVANILKERENGYFKDYFDFLKRIYNSKTNTKALENLILSGACDVFGLTRKTMIGMLPAGTYYANLCKDLDESLVEKPQIIYEPEFTESELLKMEYELYGFYIKNHPVTKYKRDNICLLKDIVKYFDKIVNVLCMIDSLKETTTKKKEKMAFISASDDTGKVTIVVFPLVYQKSFGIKKGDIIKVTGRVERRLSDYQLVANKVEKM